MSQDRLRPDRFLPLPPVWLDILLALCAGDQHGYAMMRDVARVADTTLHPGTLYRALARLLESALIVEVDDHARDGHDERRRYYRVTDLGRVVAHAETARLERVLARAHAVKIFA